MLGDQTGWTVTAGMGLLAVGLGVALSHGAWLWAFAAAAVWAGVFPFSSKALSKPLSSSSAPRVGGSALSGPALDASDLAISGEDIRALFDAVPALIAVIDADMRFEYANRAHHDLHGRPARPLAGSGLQEILGASAFANIEPFVLRALKGERVRFDVEIPSQQTGGTPLSFSSVYVPRLRSDGSVSGFYSLSRDVTNEKTVEADRRTLEQRMLQSEKLESLGILAGGIAHDFNNLLVSMMANVDIVRRDLKSGATVDAELYQIEVAAQSAAVLCRQMLDSSGHGSRAFELVDLTSVACEMSELLESSLPAAVRLQLDPASTMAPVHGDSGQIRQVIISLITNASEAISDGAGSITIGSGVIYANADTLAQSYIDDNLPAGRYAFLQVDDTGSGMNEEVLSNLFDPFFSTKFTGRGLGLASTLGIVRGHRGAIEVVSEPGSGTQIRVLIPVLEAQAKPKPAAKIESIDEWRGSGTVLVVDDDPGLRKATHRILQGCGLTALTAASGAEALEIIEAQADGALDLIVLDLTMPMMDGAETLAKIREIDAHIPVLLCSGYTEAEVQDRCKGLEYSGMLAKPFGFVSFAGTVRALLED